MKNVWKWIAITLAILILLALFGLPFFRPFGYGMMDGGLRGSHMFGGYGFYGGGFMMFGIVLIPLVVIGLLVWIGVSLTKNSAKLQKEQPSTGRLCPHCGKVLQADWVNCPYCGEKI